MRPETVFSFTWRGCCPTWRESCPETVLRESSSPLPPAVRAPETVSARRRWAAKPQSSSLPEVVVQRSSSAATFSREAAPETASTRSRWARRPWHRAAPDTVLTRHSSAWKPERYTPPETVSTRSSSRAASWGSSTTRCFCRNIRLRKALSRLQRMRSLPPFSWSSMRSLSFRGRAAYSATRMVSPSQGRISTGPLTHSTRSRVTGPPAGA